MGAALGAALKPVAAQVIWAAAGRSDATSKRAEIADLVAVPTSPSSSPAAISSSRSARRMRLWTSPARCGRLDVGTGRSHTWTRTRSRRPRCSRSRSCSAGIGWSTARSSAHRPGVARTRCCGWPVSSAAAVAALFAASPFEARVLPGGLGSASALKACFALQSKALPTLWSILAEAAQRYGVADEVRAELARDGIDLDAQLDALDRRARRQGVAVVGRDGRGGGGDGRRGPARRVRVRRGRDLSAAHRRPPDVSLIRSRTVVRSSTSRVLPAMCHRWPSSGTTAMSPPAAVTRAAPGSQSHGRQSCCRKPPSRPSATQASSIDPSRRCAPCPRGAAHAAAVLAPSRRAWSSGAGSSRPPPRRATGRRSEDTGSPLRVVGRPRPPDHRSSAAGWYTAPPRAHRRR